VGETVNRFADYGAVNCTKMRLAAALHPDPLGEGGEKGGNREGEEEGREGREGRGREGR